MDDRLEPTCRVLIVDDHPMVRRGLIETLADEKDLTVCGEAADAEAALALLETARPDVVVLDISLRGAMNGIELIKEIRSRRPESKVLVLSMHDESLFAERAVRAGALGYVDKAESSEGVIEALRRVGRGEWALSERTRDRLLRRALGRGPSAIRNGQNGLPSLSDRELEVFELFGRGLRVREVAERLHMSAKTVESHREHIKQKLNLASSVAVTRYATLWVEGRDAPEAPAED